MVNIREIMETEGVENKKITVGFFGAPNSGKSTLFNALMQKHVAIVSDKPQTTEKITDGMLSIEDVLIELVDTPGISFIKDSGSRGILNKLSWGAINRVKYVFFLVPANKPYIPDKFLENSPNFIVILTKIDMINKGQIPLLIEKIQELYNPKDILCVSAKYNIGLYQLANYLVSLPYRDNLSEKEQLQLNSKLFLEDFKQVTSFTSMDTQDIALDMTREAIFVNLRGEVPYNIKISNLQWQEGVRGIHITQQLLVPNVNYRIILFGSGNLEKIKKMAVNSIETAVEKKIFLNYQVKLQKK